jgi:hypothetical protein
MSTKTLTGTYTGATGYSYGNGYYGRPGGAGAAGVTITATQYSSYDNKAQITGGGGGSGGPGETGVDPGTGGSGGVGVDISAGELVNEEGGGISGGGGGTGGAGGSAAGGKGGVGLDISGGAIVVNDGTISGGAGGSRDEGGSYSEGGAGVFLNGGTLTNDGSIDGGAGSSRVLADRQNGDAVQFGSAPSTLIVEPGAQFLVVTDSIFHTTVTGGLVVANSSVDDTLQLDGAQSPSTDTGITLGTQFTGFQTLDFASGASWTVDVGAGAATSHTLTVEGFTLGDTIDITNVAPMDVAADFGATGIAFGHGVYGFKGTDNPTFTYSKDGTVVFSGDFSGEYFILKPDSNGGTDVTVSNIACFRRGTHILTERGEAAIESLKIGDRVATLSGVMRPIRWIGRRSYCGEVASGNSRVLPIRIRAGALGEALPKRNLWVSPEHAMYVDGMLIPAAALVNGESIVQEDLVEELTYIHLEFDGHAVIFAEGAPSESFVDDDNRQMFDNAAEYARLYPDATRETARFCAPRVEEGWELQAVRRKLERRAQATRTPADGTDILDPRVIPPAATRTARAA